MLVPDGRRTVGRREELDEIGELVDGLHSGAPAVLVLRGEAGIGKSHLCRVAVARATAAGIRTAVATADELEQDRPGRLLFGAQASLTSDDLHALVPSEAHPVEGDPGYRTAERFVTGIEQATVDALRYASLLGRHFTATELAAVTVRDAVYRSISPAARWDLHRAAASRWRRPMHPLFASRSSLLPGRDPVTLRRSSGCAGRQMMHSPSTPHRQPTFWSGRCPWPRQTGPYRGPLTLRRAGAGCGEVPGLRSAGRAPCVVTWAPAQPRCGAFRSCFEPPEAVGGRRWR